MDGAHDRADGAGRIEQESAGENSHDRSVIVQRAPASFRQSASRMVVVAHENPDEAVLLDGGAAAVWSLLDTPISVQSLDEIVATKSGEAHAGARVIVDAALGELRAWHLLLETSP